MRRKSEQSGSEQAPTTPKDKKKLAVIYGTDRIEQHIEYMYKRNRKTKADKIREHTEYIEYHKREIKGFEERKKMEEERMKEREKQLAKLEATPDDDDEKIKKAITAQINNIRKHVDVADVRIYDVNNTEHEAFSATGEPSFIVVTTKNLVYTAGGNNIQFDLGRYKIFIGRNKKLYAKGITYWCGHETRHISHPCIIGFDICMGDSVGREMQKYKEEGNIDSMVGLLINFLKEPNYAHPFMQDKEYLALRQKVGVEASHPLSYLLNSWWERVYVRKWNQETYNEARQAMQSGRV